MTQDDWKTLRVPPEAYEKAKAQKEENDRTWGEQLVCDNPTTMEVVDLSDIDTTVSQSDVDVDAIMQQLAVIEERTGKLERQLEELR